MTKLGSITGFTLIEVIIALTLLGVILLGGTALFYQNLKTSGLSDVDLTFNVTMREILSAMEKDIRYSTIVSVDGSPRLDCMEAGATGISGDTMIINDTNGAKITYSLDTGRVASKSGTTGTTTYFNDIETVNVGSLAFTWYCVGGVNDKIKIQMNASNTTLGSGINVERSVSQEVMLLNSGL